MFKDDNKKRLAILGLIGFILGIGIFIGIQNYKTKDIQNIEYKKFVTMSEKGEVKEIEIDFNSPKFKFTDSKGTEYETENPKSFNFKKSLLEKGIEVNEVSGKSRVKDMLFSLTGTVISVVLMVYLLKTLMDSTMANPDIINKSENIKTRFKDIAGNEEAKEDMEFLVNFLKNPQKYVEMGAKLPKGVILAWNGKNLNCKGNCRRSGSSFF